MEREEKSRFSGQKPFSVCVHEVVYSECTINKWWAACSANICCCTGSYFLLSSNIANIICFEQETTVELSFPEFINVFQSVDETCRSAQHSYEQISLEVHSLSSLGYSHLNSWPEVAKIHKDPNIEWMCIHWYRKHMYKKFLQVLHLA